MLGIVLPIVIAALVLVGAIETIMSRRRARRFWSRACTGRLWRRAFPHVPREELRAYLRCVADAFGWPVRRSLCLLPDDRVMDLYRTANPLPLDDGMELERLAECLEQRFAITFEQVEAAWHQEITLGQLFGLAKPREQSSLHRTE